MPVSFSTIRQPVSDPLRQTARMKQFILTVHGMVTQMTGNLINRIGRQEEITPSVQLELPLEGLSRLSFRAGTPTVNPRG